MSLKEEILKSIRGYKKTMTTTDLRRVARGFKEKILKLSLEKRLRLALSLYKSKRKGAGLFATTIVNANIEEVRPKHFPLLDDFLDNFINWGTTDDFCLNVVQPLLRKYPRKILSILRRWNKAENTWKRRASVVAFVRTVGEEGKFKKECRMLCDNLKSDPEYLVRKAVKWALKDNF